MSEHSQGEEASIHDNDNDQSHDDNDQSHDEESHDEESHDEESHDEGSSDRGVMIFGSLIISRSSDPDLIDILRSNHNEDDATTDETDSHDGDEMVIETRDQDLINFVRSLNNANEATVDNADETDSDDGDYQSAHEEEEVMDTLEKSQEDSEGESDVVVLSDESNEDCPLVELLDEIINLRDQVESSDGDSVEVLDSDDDDDADEGLLPGLLLRTFPNSLQEEEERGFGGIEYDTALPTQHTYLPDSTEIGARQYSYWGEGETVQELPVISIDNVLICPGQIVPLRLRDHNGAQSIRTLLQDNKNTFGVFNHESIDTGFRGMNPKHPRGVTIQILEVSNEAEELCLKAIGRQRFRTTKVVRQNPWTARCDVVILADVTLSSAGRAFGHVTCSSGCKMSALTQWPGWLYKLHDTQQLMTWIRDEIKEGSPHVDLTTAPQDPLMFSFWLIQSMPFALQKRVDLLEEDNVISRLQEQFKLLQNVHSLFFICSYCSEAHVTASSKVGRCSQLFSMSSDGPSASYVNPHGYIHETVTLYNVIDVSSQGVPTPRDSWFPGYAWSYIHCTRCESHLGWKFSATKDSQKPQCFYGVRRDQVEIYNKTVNRLQTHEGGQHEGGQHADMDFSDSSD